MGRYEQAVDAFKESVAVFHELADWNRTDIALDGFTATAKAQRSGRIRKAWRHHRTAVIRSWGTAKARCAQGTQELALPWGAGRDGWPPPATGERGADSMHLIQPLR
ncbi:hypothetical protein OH805_37000 [Streptomyces sp. NBC_00879]|uniref:hypothetical protein n=1 Tax=Streptomyces sp. NBC_00879 TaxID=2975855 RepID=UPI00386825F1|nr:hypothetical protein OH805_37000 [Streptomyces sp. NBC_00879]